MRLARLADDDGFLDMETGTVYRIYDFVDGDDEEITGYELRVVAADGEDYPLVDLRTDAAEGYPERLAAKLYRHYNSLGFMP